MLSILVKKIKFYTDTRTSYWYISGLTNFELLQLLKANTPIQHPTYYTKDVLEKELNEGKIRTIPTVYIDPSFNPENLYKLLK
jgi:hypothetical protein